MYLKCKIGRQFLASLGLCTVLLIVSFIFTKDAQAATREVCPSGCTYSTIQAAITAASNGDIVLVDDGVYTENINYQNKAITIQSVNGAASTIIDGDATDTVVIFSAGLSGAVLDGFTVRNGLAASGGGIRCATGSSPTIKNCIITNNTATGEGGAGIQCADSSSPTITNCIISSNIANSNALNEGKGAGIHCGNLSSPTIKNCTIINNSATGTNSTGGGLAAITASPTIINCIFYGNSAVVAGGGIAGTASTITVRNSILWGNLGGAPSDLAGSTITVTYSDIEQSGYDGIDDNISSNPLFVDTTNYHLQYTSPCRNTGHPDVAYNDLDASRNDMGADGGPDGVQDITDPTITAADGTPMSGNAPLGVSFTGAATDDDWGIYSYSWDFDDSDGIQVNSTEQDPNYIYDNCGTFTATLTVTAHSGRSSSDTVGPITVGGSIPTASASTTPDPAVGIAGSIGIDFNGSATGGSGVYFWSWDFGDGNILSAEDDTHIYTTPGNYTAILTVTDDDGCYDSSATIDVTIVTSDCSDCSAIRAYQLIPAATGGTVTVSGSPIDGTAVSIPAAAISSDTVVIISEIPSATLTSSFPFPAGIERIGRGADFGPSGAPIISNVTITLTYDNDDVPVWLSDENDIRVYFYNTSTGTWVEETTNITRYPASNRVEADVDHFTMFALAAGDPTPPGNLTATAMSESRIDLSWADNSSDEDSFSIERKEGSGGTYSEITTVLPGIIVYEDNSLPSTTEYWYRVRALGAYGYSEYSNETSATTEAPGGSIEWVAKVVDAIQEGDINTPGEITADITQDGTYVYVAGTQWNGSNYDYIILKYAIDPDIDPEVDLKDPEWTATYNGAADGNDMGIAIAVIGSGVYSGVYVTGKSTNSSGNYDYVTQKYSLSVTPPATTPDLLWSSIFSGGDNGAADDIPVGMAVDASGNVYVTGTSYQQKTIITGYHIEFDAKGDKVISATPETQVVEGYDYATVKYDSAGLLQWGGAKIYDGIAPGSCGVAEPCDDCYVPCDHYPCDPCDSNGSDYPTAIKVVSSGDGEGVYVTGMSSGVIDLGNDQWQGTGGDYLTIKYNLDGSDAAGVWPGRYDYEGFIDEASGIAVDEDTGDVYVTGKSKNNTSDFDYATLKYNSSGERQWGGVVKRYDGTATGDAKNDEAHAIGLDSSGDVYVTGLAMENGTIGTSQEPKDSENYVTIKYNKNTGDEAWPAPASYDNKDVGLGGSDRAYALAVQGTGVYVTGTSSNGYLNIKYLTTNGGQVWVVPYRDSRYDIPQAITVSAGHAYIVGISQTKSASGDDLVTIKDAPPPPDNDGDGLPNSWEEIYGLNPDSAEGNDGANGDPDEDGLTNLQEYELDIGISPIDSDSDGDGMDDKWEVDNNLDPLVNDAAGDADSDGYSNLTERDNGTDPQSPPVTYYVDGNITEATEDGSFAYPFNSIEEGIAVAKDGDTVQVAAGTYLLTDHLVIPEDVKLIGKRWYVCTIDLADSFQIQAGSYSTLTGFTITNPPDGLHVVLVSPETSSATITNNVIQGNMDAQEGYAAIFLDQATARVENNTIDGGYFGIRTNTADGSTIVNNIVLNNVAAYFDTDSDNTLITVDYNNFWGNTNPPNVTIGPNNISQDPLFVSASGNYHLKQFPTTSPCVNAGNEAENYNDKDGSRNDLGADGGPDGIQKDTTPPTVSAVADVMSGSSDLTVNFTGTASDEWEIASWSWDFDSLDGLQTDSALRTPSYTFESCGDYIVTLTVTDHSGNSVSTTIESITVDSPPVVTASASEDATITSSDITFSGSASGSVSYTWVWDFGDGTQETGTGAAITDVIHSYAAVGSYTVILIVTADDSGCKAPATVSVTIVESSCTIQKSQAVTANTPTSVSTNDGVVVEIPASALPNDAVITISTVTSPPALPDEVYGVGAAVDFGPDGATFSEPVTIILPYPDSVTDPYNLKAYYYDTATSSWVEIEVTSVDTDNQLISATTDHFTTFNLGQGVPVAPSGLAAGAVSDTQINLGWADNSSDEIGFKIERKTGSGGTYTEIASVGANTISYQDGAGLTPSTEYYYRVRAYNANGNSSYSAEANETTLSQAASSSGGGGGGGGGGCFIATAAYGTPMAKQVKILCQFRDKYLLTNVLGREFVDFYYKYSPPIAEYIAQQESLRKLIRVTLWPLVAFGLFMVKLELAGKLAVIILLLISGYLLTRYLHKFNLYRQAKRNTI